jgi:SAM-dependent methyltransferase
MQGELRLYTDLARWWPLFSPPSHYVEEAADVLPDLLAAADAPPTTLLELGSGAGSLASHFKDRLRLTLTDRSDQMLAVSRAVNPECEHVRGDMRTLDLGREFDVVLIQDAIMYLLDGASVQGALAAAYRHCREGGGIVVVPDCVRETFAAETGTGGEDAPDGPDASDDTFETAFAFLLREADGSVTSDMDRHRCGLFARAAWLAWLREAGFVPGRRLDPWNRDVFTGRKPRG